MAWRKKLEYTVQLILIIHILYVQIFILTKIYL